MAEMATAPQTTGSLEFSPEQNRIVRTLSVALVGAGVLFMLLAAAWAVTGGVMLWKYFTLAPTPASIGFWRAIFALVEAGLAFLLGNILLTASQDFGFIVTTQGHDRKHLQNGVTSLKVFNLFLLGLALVVAVHVGFIAAGWI
jgi:hypothetical protein